MVLGGICAEEEREQHRNGEKKQRNIHKTQTYRDTLRHRDTQRKQDKN